MKANADVSSAKAETEEIPVREKRISIKEERISTRELDTWLKKEEKAIREFKRIGKRIRIAEKAVLNEIKISQEIAMILKNENEVYVRNKIKRKISRSKKLEQRFHKHIKNLVENLKEVILRYYLEASARERLRKAVKSLEFYNSLIFNFWKGDFGFENELKEWKADSLNALRRMFPIYLRNLIDLLRAVQNLAEEEKQITIAEKHRYKELKRKVA